jgi:hypothetical protein
MLTIVSGCPRSGTSLCMNILRKSIKDINVLGKEFPQEDKLKSLLTKNKDESEEQFNLYKYSLEKSNIIEEQAKKLEQAKKMNPNGFWENGIFSVSGLIYNIQNRYLIKKIRNNKGDYFLAKIVSQGLLNTDPELIDYIIYMVRNPYEVAKSQEDLVRNSKIVYQGKHIDLFDDQVKVYSPQMFINVTYEAALFFEENKDLKTLIVDYEDFIKTPKNTLFKIQ